MSVQRQPVVLFRTAAGDCAGFLSEVELGGLSGEKAPIAAVGAREVDVLRQLKEGVEWLIAQEKWDCGMEIEDAQLRRVAVSVRPEHVVAGEGKEEKRFACETAVSLEAVCVVTSRAGGVRACSVPLFGSRFRYHDENAFKDLVRHHVQHELEGLDPTALSRMLPAASAELRELAVSVKRNPAPIDPPRRRPALDAVSDCLGARRPGRVWERDREVRDLARRLGTEKASILIVGEPGAGKTAVLLAAIREVRASAGEDGPGFHMTSGPRLISGMRYFGQWEERCEEVIAELGGKDVLCVENLLDIVRLGGFGAGDSLAAFFMRYLRSGELRMVAEASPGELEACRLLLPGFADLFQVLRLESFGQEGALKVLQRIGASLAADAKLGLDAGVPDLARRLFGRFMPYQPFPGRPAAFMRRLFEAAGREKAAAVGRDRVLELFIRDTGLPESILRDELPMRKEDVAAAFSRRIIGQPEACEAAAAVVSTIKAALSDPKRPLRSMLFCGPTGVGKTALAQALADHLFGHGAQGSRMLRLDMSEFAGPGAVERLFGTASGEPSDLIRKMRCQPFRVLLFDEVEKADGAVLDALLGVLDEGRLTDRFGRVTDFRSAVIVMTSNLGAAGRNSIGFSARQGPSYSKEIRSFFRPEFYNRIDQTVVFDPLGPETVRLITVKELNEIAQREGLARAHLRPAWTDRLLELAAREGFDPRYGARPLQRTLERLVVTPLARFLLKHPGLRKTGLLLDADESGRVSVAVVRSPSDS